MEEIAAIIFLVILVMFFQVGHTYRHIGQVAAVAPCRRKKSHKCSKYQTHGARLLSSNARRDRRRNNWVPPKKKPRPRTGFVHVIPKAL